MLWLWLTAACDVTRFANLPQVPPDEVRRNNDEPVVDSGLRAPVTIQRTVVDCIGQDVVTLQVETTGFTNGQANAYLIETTDVSSPWDEEHELPSVDRNTATNRETLRVDLADDAGAFGYDSGLATFFDCSDNQVDPSNLTWVFRVYYPDDQLADCFAMGHDPQGVVDGEYRDVANHRGPRNAEELEGCRVMVD